MKNISLFLIFSLFTQSFAWAGPKDNLKSIIDEYRYAVTIEWDQQNQEQLEFFKAQFNQELKKLVVDEKLSALEFEEFLIENSNDFKVDANILESVKDQKGKLSLERTQQMLEKSQKDLYQQGSSWAPNEILKFGLITLVVFEIIVLIITAKDDKCPNSDPYTYGASYACVYN